MGNKPKIAVDVDGVLADVYSPIFQMIGLPYTWEDVKKWDFFDDLHVDRQTFWDAYKKLWSEEFHLIPLIEEDSPQILAEFRKRFEVHIMTSRPKETFSGTVLWLRLHGIEYDKLLLLSPLTDKTELLHDYLCLIDDNPAFFRHPKVIIYDRPWNRHIEAKRIRSLRELIDILPILTPPQRG